jgi:Cytochrome oxidase complex assembly protein 1
MTTKKIVLIIAGVVGVLALVVALFVVAIGGVVFHKIGSSEAAETARTYLRGNQVLKNDIGEVKEFGWFVTGNMSGGNGDGEATLYLKVIGEQRTVNARVDLMYRSNRSWRVTGATYDRDGKIVDLMQSYESTPAP